MLNLFEIDLYKLNHILNKNARQLNELYLYVFSGSVLLTLTATDSDGPQQLHFSIPTSHPSAQYVELQNERGDSVTGRFVDVVLKAELDRDYTVSCKSIPNCLWVALISTIINIYSWSLVFPSEF